MAKPLNFISTWTYKGVEFDPKNMPQELKDKLTEGLAQIIKRRELLAKHFSGELQAK